MATESSDHQEVQTLLQCPLCSVPYDNKDRVPKLLNCHHTFCLTCLKELASDRTAFSCPTCQKKTKLLAKGGIDGLPFNVYVSKMREMMAPKQKGHSNNTTCEKHTHQPLLFFCETCMVPICMNCTVLDHERSAGHQISDVEAVFKVYQRVFNSKLENVKKSMTNKQQSLQLLKTEMSNLEITKMVALSHMQEMFDQMKEKLSQRQEELEKNLVSMYIEKKTHIVSYAQVIKGQSDEFHGIKNDLEQMLQKQDVQAMILATKNINTIGKLEEMSKPIKLKKFNDNFLMFDFEKGLQDFVKSISNLGDIVAQKPLPSDVVIDINPAISSLKTTVKVIAKGISGEPVNNYPLTSKIIDPCNDSIPTKIQGEGDGIYTLKWRPQLPGKHRLKILFNGEPINGTIRDFEVESNNPVLKFGVGDKEERDTPGQLYKPTSLAISPSGNIYVADMGNKRVQVFNAIGKVLKHFKVGTDRTTTYDIAINHLTEEVLCSKVGPDETGRMLGNAIQRFNIIGERLGTFVNKEMQNGLFLAVNSKGWIIVTDSANDCIFIHSKDGILLKRIGKRGNGECEFNFPSAICIGKDDDIIVSDTKNHRIQVLNKGGGFLRAFGAQGDQKGMLNAPRGVASDKKHYILVADSQNRIQIFNYNGVFLSCIDSAGDSIREPYNLAVSSDGNVFVADYHNHCIKKFRYM